MLSDRTADFGRMASVDTDRAKCALRGGLQSHSYRRLLNYKQTNPGDKPMRYVCALAAVLSFSILLPAKPPVPRPAQEFSASDPNGKPISVSKLKGKVVLIQFLITNCTHCQALSQLLTKLQGEYGPRGLQA